MAGKWRQASIGALCDAGVAELQTGPFGTQLHAYDYVDDGVPVVPTEAIRGRQIDHSVLPKITQTKAKELERHRLRPGDILFARRGVQATGHIGCVRKAEDGFICGTGAIRLRVARDSGAIDPDYLSHVLANPSSVQWFKFHAIGATMPNLNEGIIRSYPLSVPPLPEQRAIAHILGTLDDKIELNRRMNETLEATARALFKSWFVDFDPVRAKAEGREPGLPKPLADLFPDRLVDSELGEIPEGWDMKTLGDVAEHPRRSVQPDTIEPDVPYIALEHMPKRCIALSDWGLAEGLESNKFEFKKGEILFGKLRPYFHKVGVAPVDGVCSTDIVVVAPQEPHWFAFVLGLVSSDQFVEFTNAGTTGTKMPRTSWADMARYELIRPPNPIAKAFTDLLRPSVERIIAGIHESRSLALVRDALLPRLISGELRAKEAEKSLERLSA
jgi:type I restriction enzyme S subunit